MMWTINVKYQTGDSFGSSESEDTIPVVWENLALAKEALQAIRNHNTAANEIDNARNREAKIASMMKYNAEYWFLPSENLTGQHWDYNLAVLNDDRIPTIIHAFWRGYFERIICAKIVKYTEDDEDDGMEIYF